MSTLIRNSDLFPSLFNGFFNDEYVETFKPSANIIENDDAFEVELALPGYKKDDFKIEVSGNMLSVSTEFTEEDNEETDKYLRREFSFKSFNRSFRLPRTVESEKIEASFENGILSLNIPKREDAKTKEPRLIAVN